jgi:phage shock protein A
MGLIERLRNAVRANVTELAERADDPERQLDALVERLSADLSEASLEIAAATRDERALADELAYAKDEAARMAGKARVAMRRGDEELAREAMRRALDGERRAEQLAPQHQVQCDSIKTLQDHVAALRAKIEETRHYRDLVGARRRLAAAQRGILRNAGTDTSAALDRLEGRVMDMDAEAQATQDEVASRLQVIEQRAKEGADDEVVDRRLATLRNELGREQHEGDAERT